MQSKKLVSLFSLLILALTFFSNVQASPSPVTFQGIGVYVDLTYPEEAHPIDRIYHNLTITAQTYLSPLNITLYIYAPTNSGWQLIDSPNYIYLPSLNPTQPFTTEVSFVLPQNTNGTLRCTLDVTTNQTNYSSLTFYTTQVRTIKYGELVINYSKLLFEYSTLNSTYNDLKSSYETLNATYYSLLANHTSLISAYATIDAQNEALQTNYNTLQNEKTTLQSRYTTLEGAYNSLLGTKDALQLNYTALESIQANFTFLKETYNKLKSDYDELDNNYTELETTANGLIEQAKSSQIAVNNSNIVMGIFLVAVVGLIVLIIYIKKKEPEPYMVIRKETVAIKPDEKDNEQPE